MKKLISESVSCLSLVDGLLARLPRVIEKKAQVDALLAKRRERG